MAKRQRKPTPAIKRQTSNDKILGATVTTSDRSSAKFKRTDARELARRVQQFVLFCGMFNATNCASQKMRLYRKAGARGSRAWAGKQITDRKRLKYLYNPQRGHGPGLKAAQFAMESAGIEEVPQHPALDLLNNSNPYQRGTTFAKQCWLQWEFFGRRAVHIVQPKNDAPSELYIMYADRVRPIPDAKLFISGYVYGRDTTVERVFTPDEVLWQVWCPHPFDPYGALCPLHSVFAEADLYGAYSESELAMMRNGARPDFGVKVSTDTTDIQLKQMRESIEQRHRGPQHRGEFFIFRDADFVPLNFSNKEMENLLGRQDIRSTIGAAYGIPETFWRMNDANLAGSQTAQEFYFRMTVAPRLAQDAEEWTETLLPRYGIDPGEYWFAYDDCVPENKAEVRSDIQTYVMLGILDVDEARAELGYGKRKQTDSDETEDEKPEADKPGEAEPGEKSVQHLDHSCEDHKAVEPSSAAQIQMESIVRGWLNQLATALHLPKDESRMIDSIPKQIAKYVPQLASSLVAPLRTLLGQGIVDGGVEIGQTIADPFALYPDHAVQFVNQYSIRLSDTTAKTTTENVQRTVRAGVEQSLSYNDLAASVRTQLHDEAPWRATMIARTESVRANNYGKIETYKKYGYTDIRWKLGPGACPACTAFVEKYGYETEIGTPFAPLNAKFTDTQGNVVVLDYEAIYAPPLHPNCVLPDTLVAPGSVVAATKARYCGNVVAIRTASGHSVTVTENHLVLTPRGFVPAHALRKGDYAIQTGLGQFAGGLAKPQAKNRPPTIEEVFDSLVVSGSVSSRSVPVAAEHFHGDGVRLNGEVDVVAVNGLLVGDVEAAVAQAICNRSLFVADSKTEDFAGTCDFDAVLIALRLAADGCMSEGREALTLAGTGVSHADLRRVASASLLNTGLIEAAGDCLPTHSESLGECIDRLRFLGVEADEIVSADRQFYAGHVYDLSTVSGAYVAGGIVTHNCRCYIEPVLHKTADTMPGESGANTP